MLYPPHFYREKTGKVYAWKRQSPGSLNVGRLINGEPAWSSETRGTVKEKRPLICNIDSQSLPRDAIIEKIGMLIRDGFAVYACVRHAKSGRGVTKLMRLTEEILQTNPNGLRLNFSESVKGTRSVRVMQQLFQEQGAYLLTHFDMERLVKNNPRLTCRHLAAQDLLPDACTRLLKFTQDTVTGKAFSENTLLHVTDPEPLTPGFTKTHVTWDTIVTSPDVCYADMPAGREYEHVATPKSLFLDNREVVRLLEGEHISHTYVNITTADLQHITSLHCLMEQYLYNHEVLGISLSPEDAGRAAAPCRLDELLRHTPELERLSMTDGPEAPDWPQLPGLRDVSSLTRCERALLSLLEKNPGIQRLSLTLAKNAGRLETAPPPVLAFLDTLEIDMAHCSRFSEASLRRWLARWAKSACNIKKLRLCSPTLLTETLTLFPQIETLELCEFTRIIGETGNINGLAEALRNCQNLRHIVRGKPHLFFLPRKICEAFLNNLPLLDAASREWLQTTLDKSGEVAVQSNTDWSVQTTESSGNIQRFFKSLNPGDLTGFLRSMLQNITLDSIREALASRSNESPDIDWALLGEILRSIDLTTLFNAIGGLEGLKALGTEGLQALKDSGLLGELLNFKTLKQFLFNPPAYSAPLPEASSSNAQPQTLPLSDFDLNAMRDLLPQAVKALSALPKNTTHLNSDMMEARLGQFLKLQTPPGTSIMVPTLATTLPQIARELGPVGIQKMLQFFSEWNGEHDTLSEAHITWLNRLQERANDQPPRYYAGARVCEMLHTLEGGCVLSTPWRAITVFSLPKKTGPAEYLVFDPRFDKGSFRVQADELPQVLERILGSLHTVCADRALGAPALVANPDHLIAEGGLLALQQAIDGEAYFERMLADTPLPAPSDAAIESLFLRHADAQPMFLTALKSGNDHQVAITLYLLNGLMQKYPRNYWELLQECIPDEHRLPEGQELMHWLSSVYQHLATHPWVQGCGLLHELPVLVEALREAENDKAALVSRRKKEKAYDSPEALFSDLIAQTSSFRLAMPNASTIDAFCLDFMRFAEDSGREVIFIDSPEALQCANPFIQRLENGRGRFAKGPGGTLHGALQNHDNPPLIVLNSNNFLPEDLVRFNTLLDIPASSDNTPLPKGTGVILLENAQDRARHQGGEFYSRIRRWMSWPFASIERAFPPLPFEDIPENIPTHEVDLFNARDWKELLLGRWRPSGEAFDWAEGRLSQALKSRQPIVLRNAPLHDREFMRTFHMARIKGYFEHEGLQTPWPAGGFIPEEGYTWSASAAVIDSWRVGLSPDALTLNAFYFSQIEERYRCADGLAFTLPGWVEAHAGERLTLNISHPLEESQWARLLALCTYTVPRVRLALNLADETLLPAALRAECGECAPPLPPAEPLAHTVLIKSNDPDVTRLQPHWAAAHCVDISECDPSQLLDAMDGKCNRKKGTMRFWETRGLLPQLLEKHAAVILRGRFSPEHIEALTPFLLERKKTAPGNTLILLPDNPDTAMFPGLTEEIHTIPRDAVLQHLEHPERLPEKACATEPLHRLRVREQFLRYQPEGNSDLAWEGLEFLETRLTMQLPDFARSAENAAAFEHARVSALWARLTHSPLVFMAGLTGVGKSTLMETTIAEGGECTLWHGRKSRREWALDRRPGRKVLFIDEANTADSDWTEFEGLFETPPHIRIDNETIEITDEHIIVCAGNAASYGGTRKIASLFARHGNVLVVDPMPCDYLYEKILKPMFEVEGISREETEAACLEFFRMYLFLCEHSKDRVLMSPRELEMMALLTLCNRTEGVTLAETAFHFARIIGKNLVSGQVRQAFEDRFPESRLQRCPAVYNLAPAAEASSSTASPENARTFCYTPSRDPAARLLEDMLALRERRRSLSKEKDRPPLPRALLYGGLGGIVLEGPPGVGKSDLVKDLLQKHGYHKKSTDKGFYTLPASLNIAEKKRLLLKAFEKGAVVFIDEINACERLEDFLNDLLMGKHPETKEPPANPGFMLIGTQNPISDGARQQASNALLRRLVTVQIPEYPPEEMVTLLVHEGLSAARAKSLVRITEKHNSTPGLAASARITFRDLLKYAQKILGREKLRPVVNDEDEASDEDALLLPTFPLAQPPALRPETPEQRARWEAIFTAISRLRLYGGKLQAEGETPAVRESGAVACGIANTLQDEMNDLRRNYSAAKVTALLGQIKTRHDQMGTHRHIWLPLLFNIYMLLTRLPLLIIELVTEGRFFTVNTERQKRLGEVRRALKRLARDPDMQDMDVEDDVTEAETDGEPSLETPMAVEV